MAKPSKKTVARKPEAKPAKAKQTKTSGSARKAASARASVPAKAAKSAASSATPAQKNRFTLYGFAGSGPTYTTALMLALCQHPFSYIHVSLRDGAHKQPDYIVKNRFGQVPALRDGQMFLVQSSSILLHLAETLGKFDGKTPLENARIREWMFWEWDKLAAPIYRLRARSRGFRQFGDEVRVMYDTEAKQALTVLDHELAKSPWIAGKKPTAADVGIYGVLRFASDANLDLSQYPSVSRWKQQFEALPGFAAPEQLLPMESRLV